MSKFHDHEDSERGYFFHQPSILRSPVSNCRLLEYLYMGLFEITKISAARTLLVYIEPSSRRLRYITRARQVSKYRHLLHRTRRSSSLLCSPSPSSKIDGLIGQAWNQFTYNALTNFAKFTGQPPKIRVGANSQDRTRFDPSVNIYNNSFPTPTAIIPYPETTNLSVSDGYYQLAKWMPQGTHMTWGLNLGYDDIQNAINMAQSIMKAFSQDGEVVTNGVVLDFLELGNEPDLYQGHIRPANWTVGQYVADWINVMTPVAQSIGLSPGDSVGLWGCSFAGQGYTPTGAFASGLLQSQPGKLITQISQHRYSAVFCNGGNFQLESFMSKASIRGNLTSFNADIAATKAMGLKYLLGETNSIACHGAPGVSNTAGAALWALDYTLQAATLGIEEVFFHEGIGYKYNFFQPVALNYSPIDASPLPTPLAPHVQPPYYGGIIIANAVGKKAASGETKIVELNIYEDNISGYAIYEHEKLVRAVFINLNAWLTSDVGNRTRQSTHLDFNFASKSWGRGGVNFGDVNVQRLTIGFADDTANLTWNGQSYETPDALVTGEPSNEWVHWSDGLDIVETEAVLVSF